MASLLEDEAESPILAKMSHGYDWPVRQEACCCGLLHVRKVGNIFILLEWPREGRAFRLVVGPYWRMLLTTIFVIAAVTSMVYGLVVPREYHVERFLGLSFAVLAIASLLCTAMTEPGIFPRYSVPLARDWTFSEYSRSYRPPDVVFCQHCQVLIEAYNHFCPWSGIVIGKGNEGFFHVFVAAIMIAFIYDLLIIALTLNGIGFSDTTTTFVAA